MIELLEFSSAIMVALTLVTLWRVTHTLCERCNRWGWRWHMVQFTRPVYHSPSFETVHYCEQCNDLRTLDRLSGGTSP